MLKNFNKYPDQITYIKLRKNVGEHNSIMAGINNSNGEWSLIIDDDFQNSPSEALKLINYALNNTYDVVYGDYKRKTFFLEKFF